MKFSVPLTVVINDFYGIYFKLFILLCTACTLFTVSTKFTNIYDRECFQLTPQTHHRSEYRKKMLEAQTFFTPSACYHGYIIALQAFISDVGMAESKGNGICSFGGPFFNETRLKPAV